MDPPVKKPAPPPVPNRSGRPVLVQSCPKELSLSSPTQQPNNDLSVPESSSDPSSPINMLQRRLSQIPKKPPPLPPISHQNSTEKLQDDNTAEIPRDEKEPELDKIEQVEGEKERKHRDKDSNKKKEKDKKKKKKDKREKRRSHDTEDDKSSSSQTTSATTSELFEEDLLAPIMETDETNKNKSQKHVQVPAIALHPQQEQSQTTPLPRFSSLAAIPRLRIDQAPVTKSEDNQTLSAIVEEITAKNASARETVSDTEQIQSQGHGPAQSPDTEEDKDNKGRGEGGRRTPRQHSATCLRSKVRSKEKHQVIKSKPTKSASELPQLRRLSQDIEVTTKNEDNKQETSPDMKEKKEKDPKNMEKQRQKILEEILVTEKDYVADLYIIIDVFLKPLQELCKGEKSILSRDNIQFIFSNVEVIVQVNHRFLNDLEDLLKDSPNSTQDINAHSVKIGNVFLNMANYFKAYTQYCANQPNTTRTLEECKKNVPFQNFLKNAEADPRCRRLSLFSFLIKPIQRICKYPLFMKDIVKNTATEDEAYPVFTSALQKIEEVVEYVNNHKKDSEEKMKVYDIQQSLESLPPEVCLVDPARRLKMEGDVLLRQTDSDKKSVECRAFLFNDQVVFAAKKGMKSNRPRLVYKGRIMFSLNTRVIINESSCRVVDGEGGKEKDFTFFCPQSFDTTQLWIQELKLITRPLQIQKMSGETQPERRTLAGTRGLTSQSAMMTR